jgi:hypothetical protein
VSPQFTVEPSEICDFIVPGFGILKGVIAYAYCDKMASDDPIKMAAMNIEVIYFCI